jgi:uncharacterized damage-inducible protein DinB
MDQHLLLGNLEWLTGSLHKLFALIEQDGGYRPRENMRTLLELATHLAQVPSIDLLILQGAPETAIRAREAELTSADPERIAQIWTEGVAAVKAHFAPMDATTFATTKGKAFYGHEATMAEWLLEIVTHTYHHRAQLFTYLKQLGRPIDMFTLY